MFSPYTQYSRLDHRNHQGSWRAGKLAGCPSGVDGDWGVGAGGHLEGEILAEPQHGEVVVHGGRVVAGVLEHRAHLGYREDWDMEGEQEVERAGVRKPHPDSPLPVIGVEVVLPHKLRVVTPATSMRLHQPPAWGYTSHQARSYHISGAGGLPARQAVGGSEHLLGADLAAGSVSCGVVTRLPPQKGAREDLPLISATWEQPLVS